MTGAGGQLGRAVAALVPDAVLLSRHELDVTDRDAALAAVGSLRPAIILHAAAWTAVDAAEADPGSARAVNVGGTEAIVAAAGEVGAFVVYPSTDYVFSGTSGRPYTEEDPAGPRSVYGQTKLEAEEVVRGWEPHLIARTSWVFGDGRNFVRTILGHAADATELEVVDDQVGRPTYAPDLAGGLLDLVAAGATGTFHLAGGGDPCSWADLADAALDAAGRSSLLGGPLPRVRRVSTAEYHATRPGPIAPRPASSVLDCSKAAAAGVVLPPWREALEEYVAWLRGRTGSATGASAGGAKGRRVR